METNKINKPVLLSTLWIFVLLNYLYCDVMALMNPEILNQLLTGIVDGMEMNENFLLGAAVLMEIPIAMILLSRVLKYKANRLLNIISATIMTLVQTVTLFMGTPAKYYLFCSVIEIGTTAFIFWYALKWKDIPVTETRQ